MTKLRFRAKLDNRSKSKDWQARSEREDDRIAPKAVAQSIDTLQRWALATENIAQGEPRANEAQMVERIRDRYESEPYSLGHHEDDMNTARSKEPFYNTATQKRKYCVSLTTSPQLDDKHPLETIEGDLRQLKRCRLRSPDGRSLDVHDKYPQSRECRFSSEDEVAVAEISSKKT